MCEPDFVDDLYRSVYRKDTVLTLSYPLWQKRERVPVRFHVRQGPSSTVLGPTPPDTGTGMFYDPLREQAPSVRGDTSPRCPDIESYSFDC